MVTLLPAHQLAKVDEVATSLVLDPFLKLTTHKINLQYKPLFETSVLEEILERFLKTQDYVEACEAYVEVAKKRLCSQDEDVAKKLILSYLKLVDKDSRVEIQKCVQYSRDQYSGAKIVSRKRIIKGEVLDELFGFYSDINENDNLIINGQNDFSVIQIKSKDCLLLGPLSFVNHNCNPNSKYTFKNGIISITALRIINCGDEITVYYSRNFFGMNNKLCECMQCGSKTMTRGHKLVTACFSKQTDEINNFRRMTIEKEHNDRSLVLNRPASNHAIINSSLKKSANNFRRDGSVKNMGLPRYVVTKEGQLTEAHENTTDALVNVNDAVNICSDSLVLVESPKGMSDGIQHYIITPKKSAVGTLQENECNGKKSYRMIPRRLFDHNNFNNDGSSNIDDSCNATAKVVSWLENINIDKPSSKLPLTTEKELCESDREKEMSHQYMLRKRISKSPREVNVIDDTTEPYEASSESYILSNCSSGSSSSSKESKESEMEIPPKNKTHLLGKSKVLDTEHKDILSDSIVSTQNKKHLLQKSKVLGTKRKDILSDSIVLTQNKKHLLQKSKVLDTNHKDILSDSIVSTQPAVQSNNQKYNSILIHPSSQLYKDLVVDEDEYFEDEITGLLQTNVLKQPPPIVEPKREGCSKRQACIYCRKLVTQLPRHLRRCHSNETAVAKIESFSKNTKERKEALKELRVVGNFKHNCRVTASNVGDLVVKRRPVTHHTSVNEFCPCPNCGQYVKCTNLMRHAKHCSGGKPQFDRVKHRARMLVPSGKEVSSALREFVLSTMKSDAITNVVNHDKLVLMLGSRLCEQIGNKLDVKQKGVVSQRLRLMGRLLLTLFEIDSNIKELADLFTPIRFDVLVKAAQIMSENFSKPSVALKVGHCMSECANILYGYYLRQGSTEKLSQIRNFSHLLTSEWKYKISGVAIRAIEDSKYNKELQLPLAKDVQKLTVFIISEEEKLQSEIIEKDEYGIYLQLARVILCRLILFNRKRVGDVDRFTVNQFENRNKQYNPDILSSLSEAEKKLSHMFVHVEVKGKRGRKVPLLIPKQTEGSIQLLLRNRERYGVLSTNPFVFALRKTMTYIRGYDALQNIVGMCNLQHPERMKSTRFRKQVATMSQIMSLRHHEMEGLANFMGHDYTVHKEYYRLPESALHVAKFSKLFLAMEGGNASRYKGRNLDNLDINDIRVNKDQDKDSDSSSDSNCENVVDLPDVLDVADLVTQECTRKQGRNVPQKKQVGNRQVVVKRWSEEEVAAVKRHFSHYLQDASFGVPGKVECEAVMDAEPILKKNRTWKHVKFWVHNQQSRKKK